MSLEETYTDNISLSADAAKRSDWVTQVRPGISISRSGARARVKASYSLELLNRARGGDGDVNHYLNADGNVELLEDLFFLDAQAVVTQQNISLRGPQAQSNINDTGNRTSVRQFSLSPYLRRGLGQEAIAEARYTRSEVGYSSNDLSSSEADRLNLRLWSGPAFKLLTWSLAYSKETIDYTHRQQTVDFESVSASATRLITPRLGLQATIGYEDNNYITFGEEPRGTFWSIGPEWKPTPRTVLSAATGRRYFGSTQFLDFSHRTRLTTWRVGYSEDVTTSRSDVVVPATASTADFLNTLLLNSIPDPLARQTAVENFMARNDLPPTLILPLNFVTTTPFLQERWQASFGIRGVRNTLLANAFRQTRDAAGPTQPGTGDFALSDHTRQTGASLLWTMQLAGRTTANASVGYTRNEFTTIGREDDLTFFRVGLTRQFQPRVSGSLSYRRLRNDAEQGGASYTENAVSAALLMRF